MNIDNRIAILAEAVRLAEALENGLQGLSNEVQNRDPQPTRPPQPEPGSDTADSWQTLQQKKQHGGERIASAQNEPLSEKTVERHAREAGVSPATIKRDAVAAAILEQHPKQAEAVIQGKARCQFPPPLS